MAAPIRKQDVRDESGPAAAAAAAAGGGGGGGGRRAPRQLIELQDRRLQAAGFFLFGGGSVIIYGTVLNRSANPEHLLVGFGMFTAGVALALLTLAGEGAGRVAEKALRGF